VTPEALALMAAYPWPGNIRELRNVIFGALVRKQAGTELLASDLLAPLIRRDEGIGARPLAAVAAAPAPGGTAVASNLAVDPAAIAAAVAAGDFNLCGAVEALERAAVSAAVARTAGNASAAAALLGDVGRGEAQDPGATVRAMMRRLGIDGPRRRRR
jgi:two-component system response regulator GlrR